MKYKTNLLLIYSTLFLMLLIISRGQDNDSEEVLIIPQDRAKLQSQEEVDNFSINYTGSKNLV